MKWRWLFLLMVLLVPAWWLAASVECQGPEELGPRTLTWKYRFYQVAVEDKIAPASKGYHVVYFFSWVWSRDAAGKWDFKRNEHPAAAILFAGKLEKHALKTPVACLEYRAGSPVLRWRINKRRCFVNKLLHCEGFCPI